MLYAKPPPYFWSVTTYDGNTKYCFAILKSATTVTRDLEKNPDYKKGRPTDSSRLKSAAKEETNARC
jgi:hypothetical protein